MLDINRVGSRALQHLQSAASLATVQHQRYDPKLSAAPMVTLHLSLTWPGGQQEPEHIMEGAQHTPPTQLWPVAQQLLPQRVAGGLQHPPPGSIAPSLAA